MGIVDTIVAVLVIGTVAGFILGLLLAIWEIKRANK